MFRRSFLILISLFLTVTCFTQKESVGVRSLAKTKSISSDCIQAIPLLIDKTVIYGPTTSPSGFGTTQEIKHPNTSVFDGEHNSAWYLLTIGKDGELGFNITPEDTSNDYDFLLYKWTDTNFCNDFQKNKLKPVRSNLSNVKKSFKGVTGLSKSNAQNQSIGKGIGNAYSSSIKVKKGEKYMLILDNVTNEGKGHTIEFAFLKSVEIKGIMINSDSLPVAADIVISDSRGNTIAETQSNTKGEYSIKTVLNENQNYTLSAISDSTFIQTAVINTKTLKKDSVFRDIRVVLPILKNGTKYHLGNINFFSNQAILTPQSYSSAEALYKLMKKNRNMVIQIEGHTNGIDWRLPLSRRDSWEKVLSEDRAKTIYNYLKKKGIKEERMSTVGYSSTQPLFKNADEAWQQEANMRVEIKVVSIE